MNRMHLGLVGIGSNRAAWVHVTYGPWTPNRAPEEVCGVLHQDTHLSEFDGNLQIFLQENHSPSYYIVEFFDQKKSDSEPCAGNTARNLAVTRGSPNPTWHCHGTYIGLDPVAKTVGEKR